MGERETVRGAHTGQEALEIPQVRIYHPPVYRRLKGLVPIARASGYILYITFMLTVHLGGSWSFWGTTYVADVARWLAYDVSPAVSVIAVCSRIRYVLAAFYHAIIRELTLLVDCSR